MTNKKYKQQFVIIFTVIIFTDKNNVNIIYIRNSKNKLVYVALNYISQPVFNYFSHFARIL